MTLSQGWKNTIDLAKTDASWDDYDATIKTEVTDYTTRLSLTAPDWQIFKAQVWTETGAASSQWDKRPMQIGNKGDPALDVLKHHREHSALIMSAALQAKLQANASVDDGAFNVQLGMAYAYTKLSTFGTKVSDPKKLTAKVRKGDSLIRFADREGTTEQNLLGLNPKIPKDTKMIHPDEELTFQKAAIAPQSIAITAQRLAQFYNGGGDADYAEKITYCLGVIKALKR